MFIWHRLTILSITLHDKTLFNKGDLSWNCFYFFRWKQFNNILRYMCSLFGLGWSVVDQPSINNRDNRQIHPCFFLILSCFSVNSPVILKRHLAEKGRPKSFQIH